MKSTCPDGLYGQNCEFPCDRRCVGELCDPSNGACPFSPDVPSIPNLVLILTLGLSFPTLLLGLNIYVFTVMWKQEKRRQARLDRLHEAQQHRSVSFFTPHSYFKKGTDSDAVDKEEIISVQSVSSTGVDPYPVTILTPKNITSSSVDKMRKRSFTITKNNSSTANSVLAEMKGSTEVNGVSGKSIAAGKKNSDGKKSGSKIDSEAKMYCKGKNNATGDMKFGENATIIEKASCMEIPGVTRRSSTTTRMKALESKAPPVDQIAGNGNNDNVRKIYPSTSKESATMIVTIKP